LGFWRDTERIDLGVRLGYHEINPGTFLRSYDVTVRLFNNFRHEALDDPFSLSSWKRAYKRGGLFSNTNFEFLNYWRFSLDLDYSPDKLSDTATRGGPLMTAPGTASIELALDTDRRKLLALGVSSQYRDRRQGGYSFRVGAEIAWRPLPSIEISLLPSFRSEANPAQYVATTDDVGYEPTFGRRYLFSDLERKVLGMETRLNIAFSPRLTLQFFAQPLIDAGDYVTYKQLERSESFDFELFSDGTAVVDGDDVTCVGGSMCVIDGERFFDLDGDGTTDFSTSDESFNIRSLRLNAVLRWEYRPGSTIFLVWQQNRAESVNDGSFDFGRDLTALAATDAENVLILKVNYWLGL
jgi:hypothetical protein